MGGDKVRFWQTYYRMGDYGSFMDGFDAAITEQPFIAPSFLVGTSDHWSKLQEWVLEDPDKTRERLERINEHRALIDRLTAKAVL